MAIGMQIFYHAVNTLGTTSFYFCLLCLLSNIVDHKKYIAKTILIYCGLELITCIMTETSVMVFAKVYIQIIYIVIMYRLLLTEKAATVSMYITCFWFFYISQENITILLCRIFNISPFVSVNGVRLGKWQVVLISALYALVLTLVLKRILKPFSKIMEKRDMWFLTIAGFVLFCLCQIVLLLFFREEDNYYYLVGTFAIIGLAVIGFMLYMFSVRTLYLEQREREERMKVEILEKQFSYYQEKQKDEEKVRAVYHDMKNHMLVLEHQIHSHETAKMVEKLQREVEMYTDYVHTGNDILDIIIKDKARIAREKHIDFSVVADLKGVDFIEPLDVSTIFGNGLDNAIEASEKLPDGQGVILVKAARRQNFLLILMENSCLEESIQRKKRTGKEDDYLHGFGISNMKSAAGKYGGQLTVRCENGKFTLKILIPIP